MREESGTLNKSTGKPVGLEMKNKLIVLGVHDETVSHQDFLIQLDAFPGWTVGDWIEIRSKTAMATTTTTDPDVEKGRLYLRITSSTAVTKSDVKSHITANLSLLKSIADMFDLQARKEVNVTRVTQIDSITAEFVTLTVKDQFLSRSDMWRIRSSIIDMALYVGKKVMFCGNSIRLTARELVDSEGQYRLSARVGQMTKVLFRSESATLFLLIQLSREMWHFDEDGDLYLEKAIYGCLPDLFRQWIAANANHTLCIVLFNRMVLKYDDSKGNTDNGVDGLQREFEDYIKVIVEWEHRHDWLSILPYLKQSCFEYLDRLHQICPNGVNSSANEGNVLELLNICMNAIDRHVLNSDRDCSVISIILVTPANGLFDVDPQWLKLTKRRMVDRGIGCDFLCLSKPPLHVVPLFRLKTSSHTASLASESQGPADKKNYPNTTNHFVNNFVVPYWCECSFYSNYDIYNILRRKIYKDPTSTIQQPHHLDSLSSIAISSLEQKTNSLSLSLTSGFATPESVPIMSDFQPRCRLPSIQMGLINVCSPSSSLRQVSRKIDEICMLSPSSPGNQPISDEMGSNFVANPNKSITHAKSPNISLVDCEIYDGQIFSNLKGQTKTNTMKDVSSPFRPAFLRRIDSETTIGLVKMKPNGPMLPLTTKTTLSSVAYQSEIPEKYPEFNNQETDVSSKDSSSAITTLRGHRRSPSRATSFTSAQDPSPMMSTTSRIDIHSSRVKGGNMMRSSSSSSSSFSPSIRHPDSYPKEPPNSTHELKDHQANRSSMTSEKRRHQIQSDAASHQEPLLGGAIPIPQTNRPLFEKNTYHRNNVDTSPLETNGVIIPSIVESTQFINSQNKEEGHFSPISSLIVSKHHSRDSPPMLLRSQFLNSPKDHTKTLETYPSISFPIHHDHGDNPVSFAMKPIRPSVKQDHSLTSINPSNPENMLLKVTGNRRCWHHLLYRYFGQHDSTAWINWISITTPAALPLTTDYFPQKDELNVSYKEYTYFISPMDDDDETDAHSLYANNMDLLREMVSQRLSQGYQLVLSPIGNSDEESLSVKRLSTTPSVVPPTSASVVFYLSMGHHHQKLSLDSSSQNIEVRRYSKLSESIISPLPYTYRMASKYAEIFESRPLVMSHVNLADYPWNHADHLISGFSTELTESLHYSKSSFVLIPMDPLPKHLKSFNPTGEDLNEQELRVAGFLKFIELFQRGVCHLPQRVDITTLDRAAYLTHELTNLTNSQSITEQKESAASSKTPSLFSDVYSDAPVRESPISAPFLRTSKEAIKLSRIAAFMADSKHGLNIRDRRWSFRMHKNVFIGSECVDWMLKMFVDIQTREDAIQFGNILLERGFIEHVRLAHRFLDGHYFYRMASRSMTTSDAKTTSESISLEATNEDSNDVINAPSSLVLAKKWPRVTSRNPSLVSSSTYSTSTAHATLSTPFKERNDSSYHFHMSHQAYLDVDPNKRSERTEWAHLHYDALYNPEQAYHFQIHWLVATGRLIDELVQSWARKATQCGLLLVEIPVNQMSASDSMDMLMMPIRISLAQASPSFKDVFYELLDPEKNDVTGESTVDDYSQVTSSDHNSFEDLGFSRFFFEEALLTEHHFVLDLLDDRRLKIPSDMISLSYSYPRSTTQFTQYIHRSGCAVIQIVGEESKDSTTAIPTKTALTTDYCNKNFPAPQSFPPSFLWLRNRFVCSRPSNATLADRVLSDLVSFCSDVEQLRAFYERKKLDMIKEIQLMCRHGSLQWDRFTQLYPTRTDAS